MKTQEIFKQIITTFNEQNIDEMVKFFTKDISICGTGRNHYMCNDQETRNKMIRFWQEDVKLDIRSQVLIQSFISEENNSTWQTAFCKMIVTTGDETRAFDNLRITMIFKEEDGETKVAHIHSSFPDYRIEEGTHYPTWETF